MKFNSLKWRNNVSSIIYIHDIYVYIKCIVWDFSQCNCIECLINKTLKHFTTFQADIYIFLTWRYTTM